MMSLGVKGNRKDASVVDLIDDIHRTERETSMNQIPGQEKTRQQFSQSSRKTHRKRLHPFATRRSGTHAVHRHILCLLGLCFILAWPSNAKSQETEIKNILFIVSDDLKASVLGCYGDEVCQTPNIDRLAGQGTVFQRAYCQGTWCAPSRQSFMFSRYKSGGTVNMGENFRNNNFYSARVGKIYHMRVPGDIIAGTNGLDVASSWTQRFNSAGQEAHSPGEYACLNLNIFTNELANRQSTKMPHRPYVTVKLDGDGSKQADYKSADKAIEILRERQESDQPFFLAVGLVRPHYPMVAPKSIFELYPWQEIQLPVKRENDLADIPKMGMGKSMSNKNKMGDYPDNQKRMWAGYYASVSFMDAQVGRIIGELERLGLRESTAIVFTSDHGYHLGEHEFWQKSNLHEEVTRVPLVISAPGYQPGVSLSPVELVDLYPTLSDLTRIPVPDGVQGKSLVSILADPKERVRESALSLHNGYSLRSDRWAFIRYSDGSEELYDMNSDPNQFTNLAGSVQHVEFVAENRAALQTRLAQENLEWPKGK